MSALHLVFSTAGLAACDKRRTADDVLVLVSDGAYAAMGNNPIDRAYVIGSDLATRGVVNAQAIEEIEYDRLVDLCTSHSPVVSWND